MRSEAFILDGYVDEPACFGVPPYISPYVRYVAGVLGERGFSVEYCTVDQVRDDPAWFARLDAAALVVMIAGMTVPGKYLGGAPPTLAEIRQIGTLLRRPQLLIGGPITFGYAAGGGSVAARQAFSGFDAVLSGEIAAALAAFLDGGEPAGSLDYAALDRWSVAGAFIIGRHPSYPRVMCELETARGCSRAVVGGCAFCTEPLYGMPRYREPAGVVAEVAALAGHGALHFRLGRQPDLLAFGAGGGEFPRPRPDLLERLFAGIRDAAPGLGTLHIDNINPGTIARHEEAAREALCVIRDHHTPGDVAAFGMETADPAVIEANNLKASPAQVMRAIEVVNEVGARRREGVPDLLPGLNFIVGLAGETEATFALNEAFLAEVLDRDLLVRRVNIRQLMPFEGTPAFADNTIGRHAAAFARFKEHVRKNFDLPMLTRVFPAGTVLRRVIIEQEGALSFGRQMGSYPILVGIPLRVKRGEVIDAVVVDWGMRSVTALPAPVDINRLPVAALRWIPGVGKARSAAIAARRPFASLAQFREAAGATPIDGVLAFRPL
ncbi:MAG: radical SAM protein [Methanomicrobiaceae archaeon]|nr:radical SAM protein [Methanomicrobiaceae archaeon]